MEKLETIALRHENALTTPTQSLTRKLNEKDGAILATLLRQMVPRYPHQDLSESIKGMMHDFERLAIKYGLRQVRDVLADLRIRPGQKFFPQPDQVAEECEAMAKKEQAKVQAQLPKLGCDECKESPIVGMVMVQQPGMRRFMEKCQCRIRRELAKRALEVKA